MRWVLNYPVTFVPGSARCSSVLCLFILHLILIQPIMILIIEVDAHSIHYLLNDLVCLFPWKILLFIWSQKYLISQCFSFFYFQFKPLNESPVCKQSSEIPLSAMNLSPDTRTVQCLSLIICSRSMMATFLDLKSTSNA